MPELNLSAPSWSEDRELDDQCDGMGSSPTYVAAASKTPTVHAATAGPAEEGAELLYQQQQTSAPWYMGTVIFAIAQISLERVVYNVFRVKEMKHSRKESPM